MVNDSTTCTEAALGVSVEIADVVTILWEKVQMKVIIECRLYGTVGKLPCVEQHTAVVLCNIGKRLLAWKCASTSLPAACNITMLATCVQARPSIQLRRIMKASRCTHGLS